MSEAAGATGATGATGKTIDPGLRKNLVIIGGVVGTAAVLMVALFAFRSPPEVGQSATAVIPAAGGSGVEKEGPTSPAMAALLREKQLAEAEEARRRGKSYIPPDSGAVEQLPPPADQTNLGQSNAQQLMMGQPPANQEINPALQEEMRIRQDRLRKGMDLQMGNLVAATAPPQAVPARVMFSAAAPAPAANSSAGSAAVSSQGAAANAATAPAGTVFVDALEIFAGSTASPVDTYKTGYISARITSGALNGAFLTGRTQLVNEGLQPRFSAMRFNGRTYKVNAIALDEKTATDAVDATLDRRILQRYVMPVLMAAAGGYTAAMAQTGSSVVGVGIGGAAVTTPPPTETQAINAGLASATAMAQRAIDADAALPIRATFPAGSAIGIMFLEPVFDLDADPAVARQVGAQTTRERAEAALAAPTRNALAPPAQPAFAQPSVPGLVTPGTVQIQLPLSQSTAAGQPAVAQ